jgi:hypothetical protein
MTLIQTAKLNGVDPMAWLTDVLRRIVSAETKASDLHTLLPWNWAQSSAYQSALNSFHQTASKSFHFFRLISAVFCVA